MSIDKLKEYLDYAGILACNANPYLPALDNIGCVWGDVVRAIDEKRLFYGKVYRDRTIYLSIEAYFLLKQCREPEPLSGEAEMLYGLIEELETVSTRILKKSVVIEAKVFEKAFNFLLRNLYITAFQNDKYLNPNWSTFLYSTAGLWESYVEKPAVTGDPFASLKAILTRTMTEREFLKIVGAAWK